MTPAQFRAVLDWAYEHNQGDVIDAICTTLSQCAIAKSILLHKGYGTTRTAIDDMVRKVPERGTN